MRFIGLNSEGSEITTSREGYFDFISSGKNSYFDCEDSEIATSRLGFIAIGSDPDELGLPRPNLEGKAFDALTAELIVGGNVALLNILGSIGLSEQRIDLQKAVSSGIEALEQAASANK